jgi:hypothetical protein
LKGALFDELSKECIVLNAIFKCSHEFSAAAAAVHEPIDMSNGKYVAHYLDSICDLLPDVLERTVRNKLRNKNHNIFLTSKKFLTIYQMVASL